ncbi:hypothetical protein XENOCAPTIV_011837, partial [Xenoophorus captivus]
RGRLRSIRKNRSVSSNMTTTRTLTTIMRLSSDKMRPKRLINCHQTRANADSGQFRVFSSFIIVDKIDSNKDDFVSEEELKLWIKNVQNRHMFENVEHQWNEFDLNKDGLISWEEYRNVTDKNKDGKMDREETLDWILPADYDHAIAEAKHLLYESDTNKDGKLTKEEILTKFDLFVGSQVTNYGEALLRHDEF